MSEAAAAGWADGTAGFGFKSRRRAPCVDPMHRAGTGGTRVIWPRVRVRVLARVLTWLESGYGAGYGAGYEAGYGAGMGEGGCQCDLVTVLNLYFSATPTAGIARSPRPSPGGGGGARRCQALADWLLQRVRP